MARAAEPSRIHDCPNDGIDPPTRRQGKLALAQAEAVPSFSISCAGQPVATWALGATAATLAGRSGSRAAATSAP